MIKYKQGVYNHYICLPFAENTAAFRDSISDNAVAQCGYTLKEMKL